MGAGEVIAYPTESVWGLGCDPDDGDAVSELLRMKRRPTSLGLILVASAIEQFDPYLEGLHWSVRSRLIDSWPGPVTWLVPDNGRASEWIIGRHDSVALRVSGASDSAGAVLGVRRPGGVDFGQPHGPGADPARMAVARRFWPGPGCRGARRARGRGPSHADPRRDRRRAGARMKPAGGGADVDAVRDYLLGWQRQLCAAFAALDGAAFASDAWHSALGEGRSESISDGAVFEKGGVNFSSVAGDALPAAANARHRELAAAPWQAIGVSVVMHPRNPYAPTAHANLRFFTALPDSGEPVWWFGGGYDLTPCYGFSEDCRHWHQIAEAACAPFRRRDLSALQALVRRVFPSAAPQGGRVASAACSSTI